ncbi:Transcriptional regulator PadR-like family protein [Candidatus Izimaplasma bacterium HR1]|jgi:PadR family transcriptional regulator PadR|uniref:PadR family transcriptional regulator n=1 Tax=Candidatus Izimoplasma sp. HR1 TaxID=1541959 RepID=UPI0004F93084|nr:Transcriptional regulator PadR-like family protein [Candidatus Izimaplasma bacterium HR1]
MNTQFKKGIIELCVLKIVSNKDMYGFEVIENISKEIAVNENTIYPILRRLTKQDFFETYTESMSIGAPRKYYKITDTGLTHLHEAEVEWSSFLESVSRVLGGHSYEN